MNYSPLTTNFRPRMNKIEVFNINEKDDEQRKREMAMSPEQRLILTLDLMDLAVALSRDKFLKQNEDNIEWIELSMENE